jgi:hypothetical protein
MTTERDSLRAQLAASEATGERMETDLRTAIDRGWRNGGTLVEFCSYCRGYPDNHREEWVHDDFCLVTKYPALAAPRERCTRYFPLHTDPRDGVVRCQLVEGHGGDCGYAALAASPSPPRGSGK